MFYHSKRVSCHKNIFVGRTVPAPRCALRNQACPRSWESERTARHCSSREGGPVPGEADALSARAKWSSMARKDVMLQQGSLADLVVPWMCQVLAPSFFSEWCLWYWQGCQPPLVQSYPLYCWLFEMPGRLGGFFNWKHWAYTFEGQRYWYSKLIWINYCYNLQL